MSKVICICSAILLGLTAASAAWAADAPATSSLSTGDLIILRSAADTFVPVLAADKAASAAGFKAPPRTKLKVNQDKDGVLTVVIKDVPCTLDAGKSTNAVSTGAKVGQLVSTIPVSDKECDVKPLVSESHVYTIKTNELDQFGFRRLGFIYGGLILPYKYFEHDKSLEPGTTIGPFLGYRFGQTGWGISLIATYAVADIKVKVVEGTVLKERTFFALSRGIGFMFDITKSETPFRAGVMWGKDRVGSNNVDVYPHSGRTWMAAQLGWEFGR